jgi:FtsP/CotA-like multicopper oxidase with cupredoxin domain
MSMEMRLGGTVAAVGLVLGVVVSGWDEPVRHLARTASGGERIVPNDNRRVAGRLERDTLTLNLEARVGLWYPDGPEGPAREVAAFAEAGGPLQNPGPLIRVRAGTEVRVTVRNALAAPLTMFGLGRTRGLAADSFRIEPGAAREMRFTPREPGTYYYAGKTTPVAVFDRRGLDSQLNGAIVVDPPGSTGTPRDRVFLISWYIDQDTTVPSGVGPGNVLTINGLSWPHTERFEVTQGDSLFWRWVTMTRPPHPLHLHGFYFRVDAKGDGVSDTIYSPVERRRAVTETLWRGQTMAIAWSPTRPGNWIFHCHIAAHMTPASALRREGMPPRTHASLGTAEVAGELAQQHSMARLVLGIQVKPLGRPAAEPARQPRRIRLFVRSRPEGDSEGPRYAYVLGGSPEAADPTALPVPGPTLVLEKDQPVAITILNQSHEPAAVHWHGIEVESFPDGVPGWSGSGDRLLPAILPGDSLTVRFTPPRAGTFMYHSHFNEHQQITHGLYGAIIVLERGRRRHPETDHVLLLSDAGPTINPRRGPLARAMLNGRTEPEPLRLRVGATHRFRVINIRSDFAVSLALLEMTGQPVEWRPVAKDGADLPTAQSALRPARLLLGVGEIYDVEFTPRSAGHLTLRFGFREEAQPELAPPPPPTVVPVEVR